ncbi:MAG: hypothetical protein KJP08_02600 [Gammaproteobacteria bacterium]|nr:hypothetical protein [Gammaproteobacteria bacterium]
MLRIIGILTGAALAIAFLIIVLGVPEFSSSAPEVEAIEKRSDHISSVDQETIPESTTDLAEQEMWSDPIISAEPEPDPDLGFGGWQPEPGLVSPPQEEQTAAAINQEPVEENWYAFWSPFRSEIAANGFVSRLQETTGLDYRVVKVKTGVYEVAFAYTDDADIEDKLARISNATGLDMSGG